MSGFRIKSKATQDCNPSKIKFGNFGTIQNPFQNLAIKMPRVSRFLRVHIPTLIQKKCATADDLRLTLDQFLHQIHP